jgi:hypothetical protein
MTSKAALLAISLLFGGTAMAQTTTPAAPAKPPAHQPGVAAQPQSSQAAPAKAPSGKVDPAKEVAIRKLMEVTQAGKLGENINMYISNQVQMGLKQAQVMSADKIPQFMTTFNQKLAAAAPPSAVANSMVPVYDKLMSLEDIQGLNQFYESPLGQRALKALPQVVTETENMATQMQQKAALSVLQGMSNDYPELKAMLGPPPGAAAPAAPAAPPK